MTQDGLPEISSEIFINAAGFAQITTAGAQGVHISIPCISSYAQASAIKQQLLEKFTGAGLTLKTDMPNDENLTFQGDMESFQLFTVGQTRFYFNENAERVKQGLAQAFDVPVDRVPVQSDNSTPQPRRDPCSIAALPPNPNKSGYAIG